MASANSTTMPPTPPTEEPDHFDDLDLSSKLPDTPVAEQFAEDPFDCMPVEVEADVEKPHLITHAKVYAIAEK